MRAYKSMTGITERREFNPANKTDLEELGYFMKNKKWRKGCPFLLEFPHTDIPTMCMVKYTEHSLAR